jgi:hypothetical protein
MKFYAYSGKCDLGEEPCGTSGKTLFELQTFAGARRRCNQVLGPEYRLYRYTNLYDDKTFKEVSGG